MNSEIRPGFQLGVYTLEAELGEGGMGVVYRAVDTKLKRPVAVKFLSDDLADTSARRRFQREAQMASSLNHPLQHDATCAGKRILLKGSRRRCAGSPAGR